MIHFVSAYANFVSWIIAFGTISQFHFKILADFCVSFDCCLFEFRFAHSTQNPRLENLPAKTFIPLSKSYRFFVVSSVFRLNRVGWLCPFPTGSNFRVRIILHSVLKTLAGFCHSIGLYALTGSLGFRLDSTLPKIRKKRGTF